MLNAFLLYFTLFITFNLVVPNKDNLNGFHISALHPVPVPCVVPCDHDNDAAADNDNDE
jgi:hypothetical protein